MGSGLFLPRGWAQSNPARNASSIYFDADRQGAKLPVGVFVSTNVYVQKSVLPRGTTRRESCMASIPDATPMQCCTPQ
jgi:hypothetical protein